MSEWLEPIFDNLFGYLLVGAWTVIITFPIWYKYLRKRREK